MKNIICCIDKHHYLNYICELSYWLCSQDPKSKICLLHSMDSEVDISQDYSCSLELDSKNKLLEELVSLDENNSIVHNKHGFEVIEEARRILGKRGIQDLDVYHRKGELCDTINDLHISDGIVIMGRSEHDQHELGSNVENVVCNSNLPVFLITEEFTGAIKKITIAYDHKEVCNKVLSHVLDSKFFSNCHIDLVHIYDNDAQYQAIQEVFEQLDDSRLTLRLIHSDKGSIADLINDSASDSDLIAMGAYTHSKFVRMFIGSTTKQVINSTKNNLLLLK